MKRKLLDLLGLMFVGDGLITMLEPQRHCLLWENGPEPYRKVVGVFVEHPGMARSLGLLEMLAGVWLASSQERDGGLLGRILRH